MHAARGQVLRVVEGGFSAEVGARVLGFRVLGPLEVLCGGRVLVVGGARARAVLGLLLLNANRLVSVDRLVEGVWGPRPPATARTALQGHVSRLRTILGGSRIVTGAGGYLLRVGVGELDLDEFGRLAGVGRAALEDGQFAQASELLGGALGLWRGPAFSDVAFEHFPAGELARLEEARTVALEHRVDADLALGRHGELVGELRSLIGEHPLREHLHHQLMLALYRSGRQAEALEAYRNARNTLVEQLGIEPSTQLRELELKLLAQDPQLQAPALDARDGGPSEHSSLPAAALHHERGSPTPLVGRERELEQLSALLHQPQVRLVSLTGPGGVGKTRLALAALKREAARYRDGAAVVLLAGVRDPELVASAIATRVGVVEAPGSPLVDQLAAFLADRELLLLLDNFEQVRQAAPTLVRLLAQAPALRLLVTSRVRLHVSGEHEFAVPPLALPEREVGDQLAAVKGAEAVRLFLHRARAARYGYEPSPDELEAIAAICVALDGLPLAIELAAARTRVLTPQQLLLQLQEPLAVLAGGPSDAPDRQKTLRATLDWSYQLLDPPTQELFVTLSVFVGGFTLDTALALSNPDEEDHDAQAEILDRLTELVDHSLITRRVNAHAEIRFAMLEVIRQYAYGRLEADAIVARKTHDRHAAFYVRWSERAEPAMLGPDEPLELERIDEELDNLRAALSWSLSDGNPEQALRIASASRRYWRVRGHYREARNTLERALAATPPRASPARIGALIGVATILIQQGDSAAQGNAEQALELARQLGDDHFIGMATSQIGWVLMHLGELERASVQLEEAAAYSARANQPVHEAIALSNLGEVAAVSKDYKQAEAVLERSLAILRTHGPPSLIFATTSVLASVMLRTGRLDQAARLLRDAGSLHAPLDEQGAYTADFLVTCAYLHAIRGDHELAVHLVARSDMLCEHAGIGLDANEVETREQTLARIRAVLDPATIAKATSRGRALTIQAAIAEATTHAEVVGDAGC